MVWIYDQFNDRWIERGKDPHVPVSPKAPVAAFVYSAQNLVVTLDGTHSYDPDGTIIDWAWAFGDGAVGAGPSLTHTYGQAGSYGVTLTVTDNSGFKNTYAQTITVTAPVVTNQKPTASFTYTQASDGNWQRLDADASASKDSDGNIVKYHWDFGQSTFDSTVPSAPNYIYNAAGKYTVVLTVTDDDGATASVSQIITVTAPAANQPPKVSFTSSVSGAAVTLAITATDSDGYITLLDTDWGDGTAHTQSTGTATVNPFGAPAHTYASSGPFQVKVTATDNNNVTSSASATVSPVVSGGGGGGGATGTASKSPWTTGTVDEGLPSNVPIYKARTLQPSGTLELQTMINALPAAGIIDISGQVVNISSFSNANASGASGAKWRGLIGGISNGAFDNQLLIGDKVMAASIVSSIQAQQTAYTTSAYAAIRMANGTPPFFWMGVHTIGADQGQITESSSAQVSPIPARYKGLDFDTSGVGSILQNSLFEGINSASGSRPPWEVGALDFRRSTSQIMRRVEVSGIIPVGSKSRPNASTADPYNRGWKRSGGIQFNADKSPFLIDVSLHDALVSGLTFSIASTGNNGSNNTENIQATRLYLENNSAYGFACINNEVVLGPVKYDHCTFKSPGSNPHIKIANNSGFGSVAPNIPSNQYQVIEPIWSGGGGGTMFHMAISTAAQTSYPTVIKNGKTLTASTTTGKDPSAYYYVQKV